MQTWEYMLVTFHYDLKKDLWRPKARNDRVLESWASFSATRMPDFLNEVGAEGWELVTSTPGPEETFWYLIFKRPKQ